MQKEQETPRYSQVADYNRKNMNKRHVFLLTHRNGASSFNEEWGNKIELLFPSTFNFPLCEEVYYDGPETAKRGTRIIRVVKGETSIWADEQTRYKDKMNDEVKFEYAMFEKGEYVCTDRDKQVLDYLRASGRFLNNHEQSGKAHLFLEVDNEKALQSLMDQESRVSDAVEFCLKGEYELMYAYARMLSIPLNNKGEAEIRFALRERAKKNPDKFIEGLNNDLLRKHFWAHEAASMGIIKVDKSLGTIVWSSGQAMLKSPVGTDPLDHLAELMTNTAEGEKVYHAIREACAKGSEAKKEISKADYGFIAGAVPSDETKMNDFVKTAESVLSTKKPAGEMTQNEWMEACEKAGYMETIGIGRYSIKDHLTKEEIEKFHGKEKLNRFFGSDDGLKWASIATYRLDNNGSMPKESTVKEPVESGTDEANPFE